MGRRVEPEGEPLGSPSVEEVLAAGRKSGILKDTPDDNEEPESAAGEAGPDEEATETPAGKTGKGQPGGAEAGTEDEPEEPEGLLVDGKRYTAAEIRELERGYLREDHFTRQMQAVRAREREVLDQLKAANEERRSLLEIQRTLARGGSQEGTEEPEVTDPALAKRLQRVDDVIHKLEERLEKGEQERQESEKNDFIASTYDAVFDNLCSRFKVPDKLKPALSKLIENDDPDVFDPETRKPSAAVIAKSVERSFRHWHDILLSQSKQAKTEVVEGLRQGTRAAAAKPKGSATPKKPEPPAHKSKLLPRPDRANREWDSHEAASEFIGRASELMSGAED